MLAVKAIGVILLAVISGICYRLGGASEADYPSLPSWLVTGITRDIGCTVCAVLAALLLGYKGQWYQWVIFIGVSIWGLRDYWQWLNDILLTVRISILRQDKLDGTISSDEYSHKQAKAIDYFDDKHWYNWLLVGLVISCKWLAFSQSPAAIGTAIANASAIMAWRLLRDDVDAEEFGVGVLNII